MSEKMAQAKSVASFAFIFLPKSLRVFKHHFFFEFLKRNKDSNPYLCFRFDDVK